MRRLSLFLIVAAAGCSNVGTDSSRAHATFGETVDISKSDERIISEFLKNDWDKFDKDSGNSYRDFFGVERKDIWQEKISLPFPNIWPPTSRRSISYYAYAEYGEMHMHGPVISRTAPWGVVVLQDGEEPRKEIYTNSIGKIVSGEGSRPLSPEQAQRLIQIRKDGAENLPLLLTWTSLPDRDDKKTKSIIEYYCQWSQDDLTSKLIMPKHVDFFAWLSCPNLSVRDNGILP